MRGHQSDSHGYNVNFIIYFELKSKTGRLVHEVEDLCADRYLTISVSSEGLVHLEASQPVQSKRSEQISSRRY